MAFAQQLKEGPNPPTYIIDSGGGIQAFWVLESPVEATPEAIAHHEALGRVLAQKYGTDKVHNIDRIMRIPFTLNIPTAKKKGQPESTAKILFASSRRYENFDFIEPVSVPNRNSEDYSGIESWSPKMRQVVKVDSEQ